MDLHDTSIDDEESKPLVALPALKQLHLDDTEVSDAGVASIYGVCDGSIEPGNRPA